MSHEKYLARDVEVQGAGPECDRFGGLFVYRDDRFKPAWTVIRFHDDAKPVGRVRRCAASPARWDVVALDNVDAVLPDPGDPMWSKCDPPSTHAPMRSPVFTVTEEELEDLDEKFECFEVACDRCDLHCEIWRSESVSIDEKYAVRMLRRAGWLIGASGEQDYCPECAASIPLDVRDCDLSYETTVPAFRYETTVPDWIRKTYGHHLPSAATEPTIPEEPMPMNEPDELASAPYRVVEGDNWLTSGLGLLPGPGRILVAEDDMLRQTRGGLHLPENASVQRAGRGTVLATGVPLPDDPPMPRVGQRIGYDVGLSIGAGQDGEIHLRITKPGEIILIYEEPEPALRLGVEADWRGDDTEEIKGEEIKAFEEKIRTSEIAKDNAPTPGEGAL